MNQRKLDYAEAEALEFLKRVRALKDEAQKNARDAKAWNKSVEANGYKMSEVPSSYLTGTRLTGSLKRSSLELTVALVSLRKPD